MKVILINGSPHPKGCTYTALMEVSKTLNEEGIETEIFNIGTDVPACRGCGACSKLGRCIVDDCVNEFTKKAQEADGFIFGSPVHFAAPSGAITSFMSRAFYSAKSAFVFKPASAIVSARRGGTTAALEPLYKFFTISQMPVISSKYWNMVHGTKPEDVLKDEEGMSVMRALGRNMAWFLKLKEAGEKAGIELPKQEEQVRTNFIR
jgi:multimeric flavodoxin WrbA